MSSVGDDFDGLSRQEEDADDLSKIDDEFSIERFLEEDVPENAPESSNSAEGNGINTTVAQKHADDGLLFVMHEPAKQNSNNLNNTSQQPPNEEQILKDFCVKNLDTGEVSTLFAVDQIQQTNPIYTQLIQKFTNYEKSNPAESKSSKDKNSKSSDHGKNPAIGRLKKKRSKSFIEGSEEQTNDPSSIHVDVQKKKIKQLNQLKEIQSIQGHGEFDGKGITKGAIWCMKFNNTGEYLATGGQDGFVFVWKCLHGNKNSVLDLQAGPAPSSSVNAKNMNNSPQPKEGFSFPSIENHRRSLHMSINNNSLPHITPTMPTVEAGASKRNPEDSSSEDFGGSGVAFKDSTTPRGDDEFYETPGGSSVGSSIGGGHIAATYHAPKLNNNTNSPINEFMFPSISNLNPTPGFDPTSSSTPNGVQVYSPYFSEKPIKEYLGPSSGDVIDIAWSHKSNLLLTSSMDLKVRVFYMWKKSCLCAFLHKEIVTSVCFHPRDESIIITGSFDERIRVFSLKQKQLIKFVDTTYLITAVGTSIDGDMILAGTFDGKCLLYHYEHPQYSTVPFMSSKKLLKKGMIDVRSKRGKNRGRKVTGIVCASNKRHVLITTNDSRIRRYRLTTLTEISKFSGLENKSSQIHATYNADGTLVVAGSENNNVYIWNTGNEFMYSSNLFAKREKNSSYEAFAASDCIITNALFGIVPHSDCKKIEENAQTNSNAAQSSHFSTSNPSTSKNPNSLKGTVVVSSDFSGRIKVFLVSAHDKKIQ